MLTKISNDGMKVLARILSIPGSGQRSIGQEGLSLLMLLTLTPALSNGAPFLALTSSDSNPFSSSHSSQRQSGSAFPELSTNLFL